MPEVATVQHRLPHLLQPVRDGSWLIIREVSIIIMGVEGPAGRHVRRHQAQVRVAGQRLFAAGEQPAWAQECARAIRCCRRGGGYGGSMGAAGRYQAPHDEICVAVPCVAGRASRTFPAHQPCDGPSHARLAVRVDHGDALPVHVVAASGMESRQRRMVRGGCRKPAVAPRTGAAWCGLRPSLGWHVRIQQASWPEPLAAHTHLHSATKTVCGALRPLPAVGAAADAASDSSSGARARHSSWLL